MGSKKKKSEKKKDFVKPKLKVGKTAPRASNHTDTSFVAKTISLPNQSLNAKVKSSSKVVIPGERADVDLTHQLSLTKHHSSSTRKEVLLYIEQHLPSNPSAYNDLLNSVTPLIIDQSAQVRETLVHLFGAIALKQPGLIDLHTRSIVLFVHSAMSHIQPPIRNDSTKFLEVLVDHGIQPLAKGFFVKTLKSFCQILNWQLNVDSKKSLSLAVAGSAVASDSAKKAKSNHLRVLKKFLQKSCLHSTEQVEQEVFASIHPLTAMYLQKATPQPYAHLKLFVQEIKSTQSGSSSDVNSIDISCEDIETRQRVFNDYFSKPVLKGLGDLVKDGGEIGKEANGLISVVTEIQKVFQDDETDL